MRLSEFLIDNMEQVLQEWEDFARAIAPGHLMSVAELRNDAERMLRFVVADIESAQSAHEQVEKSMGRGPELPAGEESAAHDHGVARAVAHFSLAELVSEYRALRASVTSLWLKAVPATADSVLQLVRFNEAVDQLIAESVVRFAAKLDADANLFTASISHDLRNPLSAVVMRARLLEHSPHLDDKERAAVAQIQEAGSRLSGLVRDLQDFTRTRLGSPLVYERKPADVGKLCRAIAGELSAAYPDRQIDVNLAGDLTAEVDVGRVGQILSNLLANAIQHGTQGGRISISAAGDTDRVRITVHNAGKTIRDEDLDVIFEPLKRGVSAKSDDRSHFGLGLYICKRIAEAHGGSITATSSEAQGTSFVVVLPRTAPGAR
jgi:signal transduction histidine kinase